MCYCFSECFWAVHIQIDIKIHCIYSNSNRGAINGSSAVYPMYVVYLSCDIAFNISYI